MSRIVLLSTNVMCRDHDSEIGKYSDNIIEYMLNGQDKYILNTTYHDNIKPGWNLYVGDN